MADQIKELQKIIDDSNKIVFFGGAGVSTESGIPDFRSQDGLYSQKWKYPPETIISRSFFDSDPKEFYRFYREKLIIKGVQPNAAHLKLAELEKAGKLLAVVTQNIDGLHQAAGSQKVYELHGSTLRNFCMDCGASYPMEAILDSEGIPRCRDCGGVIKPNVVLFGEALPKYVCIGAIREITNADTLIVAGTSLAVEPAASFIGHFRGRNLVVINRDYIPAETQATLVLRGDVAEIMAKIR